MSDIFVSYKREDRGRVEPLVTALTAANLSVWWDREIRGGQEWRQEIARELEEAPCVIVVWSTESVGEHGSFVRDEASRALKRGVLLPVRIDSVLPPLGFGECQTLDLVGWHGDARDVRILDVIATAQAIIKHQARPKLRWPSAKRWRLGLRISPVGMLLCLALVPAVRQWICDLPGMPRTCLWLGFERTCSKTRESVQRHLYAARRSEMGAASSAEAQSLTLEEARREAIGIACPSPNNELLKLKAAQIEPERWQCTEQSGKHYCSMDGRAICVFDERYIATGKECL